ncbi:hypothetical protein ECC02_001673 [Trypanosoma cruzi]|uniref:Treble clef zinc finger domain-containing protein n=1 Tax=Trypanosoma cruzi TaxID=5693 RepID=A0A7J6YGA7_TRYCR|nr:hypothetical protein ECC02_001673 [Trypanosoma cruzi]
MRRILGRCMLKPSVTLPASSLLTHSGLGSLIVANIAIPSHRESALCITVRCSSSTAADATSVKKTRRGRRKPTTSEVKFAAAAAAASTRGKRVTRRKATENKRAENAMEGEEEDELSHGAVFDAGVDEAMDGGQFIWGEEEQRRMQEFDKREEAEEGLNSFRHRRPRSRQSSARTVANDNLLDEEDEAGDEERGASAGTSAVEGSSPTLEEEGRLLEDRFPDLAAEYDTELNHVPLAEVLVDSAQVASWKCVECGFKWESGVFVRTCLRTKCPQCEKERNPRLGGRFVQLWDHSLNDPCIDPKAVAASSNKTAFWHCPSCGNSYQARIKDMVADKANCPSCSLLSLHADFSKDENGLLQEWHPLKNGDLQPSQVKPNDHTKLWWLCMACGHEWEATLAARLTRTRRAKGKECPVCHGRGKE